MEIIVRRIAVAPVGPVRDMDAPHTIRETKMIIAESFGIACERHNALRFSAGVGEGQGRAPS